MELEKRCEFCTVLSPTVYCHSDAAYLCLSCDARVHWANTLSYRHTRTLVCETCRFRPADIRCLDHETFMCQICDVSSHRDDVTFRHRRSLVASYVGCPSAKELAALWGFEGGFCSGGTKVVKYDNNHLILQQIHDLERLHFSMGIVDISSVGRLPFKHDTIWKSQTSHDSRLGLDSQLEDVLLLSPFSQMDNNFSNPLQGDSFGQYKIPAHNNEIWHENMQDLGLCDEVGCFDAVNVPDVDSTFRNFEELFSESTGPKCKDESIGSE